MLDRDTDLDSLPAAISPAVRQTIQLCLQKDVRKRVADIRDVRLALEGAFETVSPQVTEAATQLDWRRALPVAVALVVGGVLVGGIFCGSGIAIAEGIAGSIIAPTATKRIAILNNFIG